MVGSTMIIRSRLRNSYLYHTIPTQPILPILPANLPTYLPTYLLTYLPTYLPTYKIA